MSKASLPRKPASAAAQADQASFFEDRLQRIPAAPVVPEAALPPPAAQPRPPAASDSPDPDETVSSGDLNAGHRKRLRARFVETGPEGLPDYELLEMVLFNAIPRIDTKPLAKQLLKRFGSFAEVIHASPVELKRFKGVSDRVICEFRMLHAVSMRMTKSGFVKKSPLTSWQSVLDYLRLAQSFADIEQFRILFLDKRNMLIADEIQGKGTVDHTPVYIREVVKRALELSASALILVHNHPSGDPAPSRADIDMTRMIVEVAKPLGIAVHDHVIVGRQGHASLKALRLM